MQRIRKVFKTEAERFWIKVDKNGSPSSHRPDLGPCWIWTGAHIPQGYGVFCLTQLPGTPKRTVVAHRWSYEDAVGGIPDGFDLDHLCRVRTCVNPSHLEPVTRKVNTQRGIAGDVNGDRQRGKTHCPQGHEYDAENTYVWEPTGQRLCKACDRDRKRAKAASKESSAI